MSVCLVLLRSRSCSFPFLCQRHHEKASLDSFLQNLSFSTGTSSCFPPFFIISHFTLVSISHLLLFFFFFFSLYWNKLVSYSVTSSGLGAWVQNHISSASLPPIFPHCRHHHHHQSSIINPYFPYFHVNPFNFTLLLFIFLCSFLFVLPHLLLTSPLILHRTFPRCLSARWQTRSEDQSCWTASLRVSRPSTCPAVRMTRASLNLWVFSTILVIVVIITTVVVMIIMIIMIILITFQSL